MGLLVQPLGAQTTFDVSVTENLVQDWELLTLPIYFTTSYNQVDVVVATALDYTYLEDSSLCSNCDGSPISYGGSTGSSFTNTDVIYDFLDISGVWSAGYQQAYFYSGSSYFGTYYWNNLYVGLISAYAGSDYDSTTNTWDGDAYADGWLGLAPTGRDSNLIESINTNSNAYQDYDRCYFDIDLGGTSVFSVGGVSSGPEYIASTSSSEWTADVEGLMVTGTPSKTVLRNSFSLTNRYPVTIDTASMYTWVPPTYWNFFMRQVLDNSIGYYFDSTLQTYVMSCDQSDIMEAVYLKIRDDGTFSGTNLWFELSVNDYMVEIGETTVCQLLLKENSVEEWRFGLSLLNQYTLDLNYDSTVFSIVNYNNVKAFKSTQVPQASVSATNTLPLMNLLLELGLLTVLSFEVWLEFLYYPNKRQAAYDAAVAARLAEIEAAEAAAGEDAAELEDSVLL